jgi:hypothetical protein
LSLYLRQYAGFVIHVRQFSTAHGVVLPLPPAYAANLAALSRKKGRRSRSRRLLNAVFAVHRTERDYGRFRTFIGARSLRTVGLGDRRTLLQL